MSKPPINRLYGPDNPNWKGGTWINPSGYRMVLVGKEHPAANCRNYAPEHIYVYYEFHGELPGDGWHVHHWDEDKLNNAPSNLEPKLCTDHGKHHLPKGSEKAREFGRKGGRAAARKRRQAMIRTGTGKSRKRR